MTHKSMEYGNEDVESQFYLQERKQPMDETEVINEQKYLAAFMSILQDAKNFNF